MGWALRDHARSQPEVVRIFFADHAHVLSGLTRREAGKHLGCPVEGRQLGAQLTRQTAREISTFISL